jgi:hypothetical protein|tara:strand:+ start:370 stop:576 length:207 start_codon:yes stop_codon:yes gene_type:complete
MTRHLHFVGFRTDSEFWSAVKVWGKPDFIHMIHDHRMKGDVGKNDLVLFGSKGRKKPSKFAWQDHALW